MLFTGEYEHTIDAKQRLAIPAEIRSRLDPVRHGTAFYAVAGPNGAVWLWPERTFEHMATAVEGTLLPDDETMEFEELFFSQAARVDVDSAGRIRLPERLSRLAGLGQNVVILGVRDHLEVRASEEWRRRLDEKLSKRGEIVLRARRALRERPPARPDGGPDGGDRP